MFLWAGRVGVAGTGYLLCGVEEFAVPQLSRRRALWSSRAGEEFHVLGLSRPLLVESVRNLASP